MKISNLIVLVLFVTFLSCSHRSSVTAQPLHLFSDQDQNARTNIVLYVKENRAYILMGYGGYSSQSAACVIKSTGNIKDALVEGFLADVNTDIVSYKIDNKRKPPFTAILTDTTLEITKADVFGLCGLNSSFTERYHKITDNELLSAGIGDFIELLQDSKGNDDLLPILKQYHSRLKK